MFVEKVPSFIQLLPVDPADEPQVLYGLLVFFLDKSRISLVGIESLPGAEGRAHGRADEEQGLLPPDLRHSLGPLVFDVEVPWLAIRGVDARQVECKARG